jgi:hypothetical protein
MEGTMMTRNLLKVNFLSILVQLILISLLLILGSSLAFSAEWVKFSRKNNSQQEQVLQTWDSEENKASIIGLSEKNELKPFQTLNLEKYELIFTRACRHS